jgi:hypothetical protein
MPAPGSRSASAVACFCAPASRSLSSSLAAAPGLSDYLRPCAGVIARRVLAALHPGAIVMMHDGGGNRWQTVAALPAVIRGIRAAGYQIVPVCAGSRHLAGKKRPAPAQAPAAHPRLIGPASTGARHDQSGISGVAAGDHTSPARATARPRAGWNAEGAVRHRISRRAGGSRARGRPGKPSPPRSRWGVRGGQGAGLAVRLCLVAEPRVSGGQLAMLEEI